MTCYSFYATYILLNFNRLPQDVCVWRNIDTLYTKITPAWDVTPSKKLY